MALMTKAQILAFVPQVLQPDIIFDIRQAVSFFNGPMVQRIDRPDLTPGRSMDIATAGNLGLFQTKAEGQPMAESSFTASKITITPVLKALMTPISLEAETGYYSDISVDLRRELTNSYVQTVDNDIFARIETTPTVAIDDSTHTINLEKISEALAAVKARNKGSYSLLISHNQEHQLRILKDTNGNSVFSDALQNSVETRGLVGTIYGVKIITVDQLVANTGVFTNYLVEDGAIGLAYALDGLTLDAQWFVKTLTREFYAYTSYQTFLYPNKKIQPIKFKA